MPGAPDDSILLYRLETTKPGAMMPELGRALVHAEGVALIEAWIAEMTAQDTSTHRADYYPSDWGQVVFSEGRGYYGHFMYVRLRDDLPPDVFAEGDRGQYIYASPNSGLIIVRLGLGYGISSADWIDGFYAFASAN